MSQRLRVSVVVATYNRRAKLPAFLDALLEHGRPDEVVVAVDGCEDGSLEYLQQRARSDPRVVPVWVEHLGQFGALDAGARAASGDVMLFLDDDVRASDDLIDAHRRRHGELTGVVVQGYMPVEIPPNRPAARWTTVLYAEEYERRCQSYEDDERNVLHHLWGGNFSVRRADYLSLGYTPLRAPTAAEEIRLYNQDRDLGLRCEAEGLRGVFDRRAAATHLHERDLEGFLRDSFGQGACTELLHRRHPEQVPPPGTGSSLVATIARHVASRPAVARRATEVACMMVRTAVRADSLRTAVACGRLVRTLQIAQGARAARLLLDGTAPSDSEARRT